MSNDVMEWIYNHNETLVSFEKIIDSNDEYDFEALHITMKLPYKKPCNGNSFGEIIITRHLKYLVTNKALINILNEMYHEGMSIFL